MKKLLFIIFLICANHLFAQERHISGYFSEDLIFYSDTTYIIDYNTRISSSASMLVLEGAEIKFASGASIIVDGNLEMRGSAQNRILVSSTDHKFQGIGFVIAGHNANRVHISYSEFENLLIPLSFKDDWYRETVQIEDNVFKNINTGQEGIYVGLFSQIYTGEQAEFNFLRNNFIENYATIFLSPIEDDVLEINFQDNLITSNYMITKELENPMNAAISLYYDQRDRAHFFNFKTNSVFNNNVIFGKERNDRSPLNIGVSGSAATLELSSNYMGSNKLDNSGLVHFFQDNQLPLILLNNLLSVPSENTHAHIWKVMCKVNEQWEEWNPNNIIDDKDIELKVFYNREVILLDSNVVNAYYYNDEVNIVLSKERNFSIVNFDGKALHLIIDKSDLKSEAIELPLAKDNKGFLTPKFLLGNSNLILLAKQGRVNDFTIVQKVEIEQTSAPETAKINTVIEAKYQFSTSVGVSLFKGDVSSQSTIQKPAYKLGLSYRLNKEFLINFDVLSTTIFSEDNTLLAHENIKTDLLVFTSSISHLLEKIEGVNNHIEFSVGAALLYFKPKVAINGYYTSIVLEEKNQLSIPLSFSINTKINKNYNFGVSITYYKTFTDYIDNTPETSNSTDDFITIFGTLIREI